MGGSRADAEDVVQEALVRALAGLRATDREIALRPWLFMIVRNRAMDHLRAPARRRSEGPERLALLSSVDADPAAAAETAEELRAVVRAIGALPERQRLALVRRELGGESHAELADGLETTIPGAKSLLVRARREVAAAMAA
jgi:RNA polymerase sigma factor (sigma-70 family)